MPANSSVISNADEYLATSRVREGNDLGSHREGVVGIYFELVSTVLAACDDL